MILSNKDPFSFKAWQEFLNQNAFLSEHKLSVEDVREAIKVKALDDAKNRDKRLKEAHARFDKAPKCPECSNPLQLLPVNDSPSTRTGDDSRSLWLCRQCYYERFSTKDVKEELEQILKESGNDNIF